MAPQRLTIQDLPAEIIKRIASFAPCESAINLLKTSQRMHNVCSDELVFKAILTNGNSKCGIKAGTIVSLPAMDMSLLRGESTSDWMRLALADSRARDWLKSRTVEATKYDDIKEWLPQMVALDHPLLARLKDFHPAALLKHVLLSRQHYHSPQGDLFTILAFYTKVTILNQARILDGEANIDPNERKNTIESIRGAMAQLKDTEFYNFSTPMAAKYTPSVLACTLTLYCLDHMGRNILLPYPRYMPLWAMMGLPMPFSGSHSFDEGFLKMMTSTSFLQDGEWVGYYSMGLALGSRDIRFDPPMQGIRFSAIPEPSDVFMDHVELNADGVDSIGLFSLSGFVQDDGTIRFTKTYAAGFSWEWDAQMTPFGIIGEWGRNARKFGHIWLWKREWSYGPT